MAGHTRPNKDRDGLIWLLYQGGELTLAQIGEMFQISRSRVDNIVQAVERRLEFRMGLWTAFHDKASSVAGQLVPKEDESRKAAKARMQGVVLWSYLRPRCGVCGLTAVHRVLDPEGRFFYDHHKQGDAGKVPCPALLCNDCYMKSARWTGIKTAIIPVDENGLEASH